MANENMVDTMDGMEKSGTGSMDAERAGTVDVDVVSSALLHFESAALDIDNVISLCAGTLHGIADEVRGHSDHTETLDCVADTLDLLRKHADDLRDYAVDDAVEELAEG